MPTSDEAVRPIEEIAQQLSDLVAELSVHPLFETKVAHALVRFPRKWIREKNVAKYPYLEPQEADLLACLEQLYDVNKWHLRVWDLRLTAGNLFLFQAELTLAMILESMAVAYCRKWLGRKLSCKGAIDLMLSRKVITEDFAARLHRIREHRNLVHAHGKHAKRIPTQYRGYPLYREAIRANSELHEILKARFESGVDKAKQHA